MTPEPTHRSSEGPRKRVLIVGAGVAGLETLLALDAMAPDLVDMTVLAPEMKFVNRSMSVDQPFKPQRVRSLRLESTVTEFGARWHRGAIRRVEPERHRAITTDGDELSYDMLVLAQGARPEHEQGSAGLLSYRGSSDGPSYRLLLHQLREGRVSKVAFVRPAGPSWPMPLYDLALMTAAEFAAEKDAEVELSFVTPEANPLEIFGESASTAVREMLLAHRVTLYAASHGKPSRHGWLDIAPGARRIKVDRVVTVPVLVGPRLRGIPCERDGFIQTDSYGRVMDVDDVFAAGDATSFATKQGGLAAQQADAVAEVIAASVGVDIDPQPFRPILRGVLLSGGPPRYLSADLSDGEPSGSVISEKPIWWPPAKISGRYLAPYLSSQVGDAADVMPQCNDTLPNETALPPGLTP